jgi:phage tail sheath protein FI
MKMALTSPGVEVTVIDESMYTPAEPGTTPLIVISSSQDKLNAAGTATAAGTLKANAGKAYKVTSQKELVDLFGVPNFKKTASNTPIHGSELNEYGLLAGYSLLGVSNAAFVVRADVDLDELEGSTTAPGANPADGKWWINTGSSAYGIQEWNGAAVTTTGGQKFAAKTPIVLTDDDASKISNGAPTASVGAIGNYAIVFETVKGSGSYVASKENATVWYKSAGNGSTVAQGLWVKVGSNDWTASHPTIVGSTYSVSAASSETFTINGTNFSITGTLDDLVASINGSISETQGIVARNVSGRLYLYSDGTLDDGIGDSAKTNAIEIGDGLSGVTVNFTNLGIAKSTYYGPALQISSHTNVPEFKTDDTNSRPSGSVWIKTTEPNSGARWRAAKWQASTLAWVSYNAPIYANNGSSIFALDRAGGGVNIPVDSLYVQSNATENSGYDTTPIDAAFKVLRRATTGNTTITSAAVTASTFTAGSNTFTIAEGIKTSATLNAGVTVTFTAAGNANDAALVAGAINSAGFTNIEASVNSANQIQIFHKLGGDFRITDGTNTPIASSFTAFNINTGLGSANFYAAPTGAAEDFIASNWKPLAADSFSATSTAPLAEPADGQLWYNPEFSDVDLMIHNGTTWVGYQNYSSGYANCSPAGPIVSATKPLAATGQSDGTALVDGDIWISTASLEDFPTIYRWNGNTLAWVLVDKTDQTTENGVLFGDARYGLAGATGNTAATIIDLLTNNYVDPDAPDPALYPKGMLLWNLRRSGGNVKKYNNNYVDLTADNTRFGDEAMSGYATDRWSTQSGNQEDGSGSFGRHAQRMVVVQALKSVIDTSSEIRDEETRNFNLISCPGYTETMSNLVNLNIDRGLTAFVIGDTPLRLASDATSLLTYGSNSNLVTDNSDDGLVTYDEYLGAFYPNGFTTDLGGSNAVVPASHMMLRTIALSDQVSFPWFAPAGTRRGGISNATSVGYIDAATGEFQTVALNEGQRDTLYGLKINPITFFNGVGLVNYGQKTRARNASALDRINVARLVVYLRSQLNKLARPYIFEPNDKITRDEIKQAVESLLLELVGLRALYDFAVVCDESNNTPSRVDRNELYVDIAIEPIKAIEFIYIPLRVKNTGEI